MSEKKLLNFFREHPKAAIAFSGGVDSAYLLYAAVESGADVCAYYVQSAFQPQFEREDAKHLASQLGVTMKVLTVDVLKCTEIIQNPANRCYYCKKQIFSHILDAALQDGYTLILDGTNASDDVQDRPGMKALKELEVRSPLRECGLTKNEIRERSREAGLFTWDKPAYACLATRIPTGTEIRIEDLIRTEQAENYLSTLGFVDFRVRLLGNAARIQLRSEQMPQFLAKKSEILQKLKTMYQAVLLDLEDRT